MKRRRLGGSPSGLRLVSLGDQDLGGRKRGVERKKLRNSWGFGGILWGFTVFFYGIS